jgi:hypothetical protein
MPISSAIESVMSAAVVLAMTSSPTLRPRLLIDSATLVGFVSPSRISAATWTGVGIVHP